MNQKKGRGRSILKPGGGHGQIERKRDREVENLKRKKKKKLRGKEGRKRGK